MIFGGNQPYFLPYIGYWQLINAVDIYAIGDDYNYIDRGWMNRNRILINGKPNYFNIEISHVSSNKKINELELSNINIRKKLKTIHNAYTKAPFYNEGMDIVERIFACPEKNLAQFLIASVKTICEYLEIKTRLVLTSGFHQSPDLKREFRIYDYCDRLGCDTYYNAIGGQEMYSFEAFEKRNIKLGFLKTGEIRYKQLNNEFVPNLSILDVIMFNSKEKIQSMLNEYTIITD